MGERAISRAELSHHQRDRVISKVTPVFAKRGYQETSVDDLLAAGKVGVGNFYSLFGGKEECFLACFERIVLEVEGRIEMATSGGADWDRSSYRGLGATLEFLCAEPLAARLVLVEAQSAGDGAMSRYDAIIGRGVAWLASGRRAHPGAADLPASFEEASISGLSFYLQQCLLQARRPSAAELLAETAGLLLEPIIGADQLRALVDEQATSSVA